MATNMYPGLSQATASIPYIGSLVSGIMNAIGGADTQARYQQGLSDYDYVNGPQFSNSLYDFQGYDPSLYGSPESAQYQGVSLPDGTREAQLAALMKMQDMGNGYAAAENQAGQTQAIMNANQAMKSNRDAAMMNARARGVGGSGVAMALAQQGNQAAANNAMQGGLQAAQNSALQKLQSANDYSQGLSSLRNQDQGLAAQNADIINRFNMFNTQARNAAAQRNAEMQNAAKQYNSQGRNQAQQYNLGRQDQNKLAASNFALQKQNAKSNLLNASLGGQTQDYANAGGEGGKQRGEFYEMMGNGRNMFSGGGNGGYMPSQEDMTDYMGYWG